MDGAVIGFIDIRKFSLQAAYASAMLHTTFPPCYSVAFSMVYSAIYKYNATAPYY